MRPKLYLETSVVSYLTSRPSHDLIRAAHQQVTRDWWEHRGSYELYISQFVLDEAGAGDTQAARRRLAALEEAALLDLTPETGRLARAIVEQGGMPARALVDAVHVAVSAVNGLEFLLTWNCTHIANASMRGRIESICRAGGFEAPVICTPLELLEGR
jgi:hypothetical protein